ncbi:glycosyl hydrolase family 28-related protein [Anaerobaca lacustris]|uniref:Glycosyl hydrolase family 28-related protein n=1 Tax=Anaerobaca lacustris TaxID=3044600 RepID=A0AAW6TTE9_9BACT|nr:glycosyl hydrolase family 28-related protein [Sedimentisphaerales bacterium M17dextr]
MRMKSHSLPLAILVIACGSSGAFGQAVNPGRVNVVTTPWSVNWLTHANDAAALTDLGASAWMQTRIGDADAAARLTGLGISPWIQSWIADANNAELAVTRQAGVYNVTHFGALGDGTTDDTAAIQAAIEKATGGARRIYFPPGVYVLGTPVEINRTNVELFGHRAILKPADGTLDTLLDIMATGSSMQTHIHGLLFSGYPVAGSHTGALIRATDGSLIDSVIENCWFSGANANKAAIHARAFHSTIRNCVFEFGSVGYLSDSDVTTYTGSLIISDCTFYRQIGEAVRLSDPGGGNRHGSILVNNCRLARQANAVGGAFYFQTVTQVVLSNIVLGWDAIGGSAVNADGLYATDVNSLSLSNAQFIGDVNHASSTYSRFNHGLRFAGDCNDVTLSNVRIANARYGMRFDGVNNVRMNGCRFEGGYTDGILIYPAAGGSLQIADSTIDAYRGYLIDARATATTELIVTDSRLFDGSWNRGSALQLLTLASSGRTRIARNLIGKTRSASDATTCINRAAAATDLRIEQNEYIGGMTAYGGTAGIAIEMPDAGGTLVNCATGSGSPSGAVTPDYIGQEYLDTVATKWYKSTGLTDTDWVALN